MARSLTNHLSIPTLLTVAALAASQATAQEDSFFGKGFITGLQGWEKFHEPVGQPIYFESPFNDTGLRALYLKHDFSDQSALAGGDVTIYALQARLALTERLALIAVKDGYSELQFGTYEDEGWNDLAAGLKYVWIADKENDFVLTPGIRYMAENGHRGILQGGVDEFSPFVSFAKGLGEDLHLIGNVTLRVPLDGDEGNTVGHWDLHVDYDVNPQSDCVVAPVAEVHGVHYLDDGASTLPVGGLDYANLGSQPDKSFVAWMGIGLRAEFAKKYEFGAVYEFALTDPDDDIMDQRITIDFFFRF
ncbi:MAG: hypothetical protein FJ265_13085 [Planctomycetes bacterium]|nr:hypothetical protein [Planctomycetota bacterium]